MESYFILDELGSPIELMDEDGFIRESYSYDEFGQTTIHKTGNNLADITVPQASSSIETTPLQPFGFNGYQMDEAGGLYYAQARRYDAVNGRFVSEDKIKGNLYIPISINAYVYCYNQPINYIDLDGMSRDEAVKYGQQYSEPDTNIDENKEYRNPEYPDYTGSSGNCTNYVSQCLYAGGVDMVDDEWFCYGNVAKDAGVSRLFLKFGSYVCDLFMYEDTHYSVRGDAIYSYTWSNAREHFEYFSNPENGYINGEVICVTTKEQLKRVTGVQPGDLIYWDWYDEENEFKRDGFITHASMVSGYDKNGNMLYMANDADRQMELVEEHLHEGAIYIVKLKDCVFE